MFTKTSLYDALKKHRVRRFADGSIEELDSPGKLCHALRKESNPEAKYDYMRMLMESTIENMVVFYIYTEHCEKIREIAEEVGKEIYIINGATQQIPDKNDNITNAVVIVQYQAGGAGIELPMCTVTVMFSPTYSYQDYVQALGRNSGSVLRQDKHVHVYLFMADGIETEIYAALSAKKDFSEKLFFNKTKVEQ
jgi:superfamily II DNA or RNA helicase